MSKFQHDRCECPSGSSQRLAQQWMGSSVAIAAVFGMGLAAVPMSAAIAANDSNDDFRRCAATLARLELPQEEVLYACSRSLAPEHLWKCVNDVSKDGYTPTEALDACRQVRRPRELAACVSDIRGSLRDSVATEVLDNCRRSLLPVRYADCVVGVGRGGAEVTPTLALNACNDAFYFPREVDPTFIPYSTSQPSLLLPETMPQPETTTPPPVFTPAPQSTPAAPATGPVRALY